MNSKIFFPVFVVCAAALYLTAIFVPPADEPDVMQIQKFSTIPVQESGRIMPFDTFARIRTIVLGHKEWVADVEHDKEGKTILNDKGQVIEEKALAPSVWALDVLLKKEPTFDRRFIRIDNDELLAWLDLDANRHGLRFSLDEFRKNEKLHKEIDRLRGEFRRRRKGKHA